MSDQGAEMVSPSDEVHLFIQWTFYPSEAPSFRGVQSYHHTLADRGHFATCQGQVRAHKVRGQVTSTVLFSGVLIEDILRVAGWRTPTTFIASYLIDTLSTGLAFRIVWAIMSYVKLMQK